VSEQPDDFPTFRNDSTITGHQVTATVSRDVTRDLTAGVTAVYAVRTSPGRAPQNVGVVETSSVSGSAAYKFTPLLSGLIAGGTARTSSRRGRRPDRREGQEHQRPRQHHLPDPPLAQCQARQHLYEPDIIRSAGELCREPGSRRADRVLLLSPHARSTLSQQALGMFTPDTQSLRADSV
jgi:hypothetical protein